MGDRSDKPLKYNSVKDIKKAQNKTDKAKKDKARKDGARLRKDISNKKKKGK